MKPEDFPSMRAAARSQSRFDQAVASIDAGTVVGSMRRVEWQDAKEVLSRAVEAAWTARVSGPFCYGGKELPEAVEKLTWDVRASNLHETVAATKRVAAYTGTDHPVVEAMRQLLAEVRPLAEAVGALKGKLVMGRAPRAEPTPVNPNKVMGTCGVCFRAIAVTSHGLMALHGYKRPWSGRGQTASCYGTRFRPLEVSNEGLRWLIGEMKRERDEATKRLADLVKGREPDKLLVRSGRGVVWIERDHARWGDEIRFLEAELQGTVALVNRQLPRLKTMLSEWKATGLTKAVAVA